MVFVLITPENKRLLTFPPARVKFNKLLPPCALNVVHHAHYHNGNNPFCNSLDEQKKIRKAKKNNTLRNILFPIAYSWESKVFVKMSGGNFQLHFLKDINGDILHLEAIISLGR